MRLPLLVLLVCTATACAQVAGRPLDIVEAARRQVGVTLTYDPAYVVLTYPGGDVASERGVCTDVIIRALVIHNIGRGTREEDSLFAYPLTGHYRLKAR